MHPRVLAIAAMAGSVCLALTAGAAASPPVHEEPVPIPPTTYPAGFVCSFPLTVTPLVERQSTTVFFDREGNVDRIQFAGALVLRFTNESPGGGSVDLNVSGPGKLTFAPNGNLVADAHGTGSFLLFPGDIGPNGTVGPGALFVAGHSKFHLTPTGQLVIDSIVGRTRDICAMVA
jgi:hypothetical protein